MKATHPQKCFCGKARQKAWHLACNDCWSQLPQEMRDRVWQLYQNAHGSTEHRQACYECIRWLAQRKMAVPK